MTRLSRFPFLSVGRIFSFSGGAAEKKKSNTKKKTKHKRVKNTIRKTRKKNLSLKKATRMKIISKKRPINKRTRARTVKKLPKIYTKKKKQCNCDPSKSYQGNELNPSGLGFCSHCSPTNITMKGLDGNLWENQKNSKGKKWVKVRVDMN